MKVCLYTDMKDKVVYNFRPLFASHFPITDFRRLSGLKKFKELFLDENFIDDTFLSSIGHLSRLKRLSLKYNYNGLGTVKLHIQGEC